MDEEEYLIAKLLVRFKAVKLIGGIEVFIVLKTEPPRTHFRRDLCKIFAGNSI